MPTFTFTRQERLKSKKAIGLLFKGGQAFVAYPLRVVWTPAPALYGEAAQVQVVISVPKRNFKTAVARNLLKRRIREAYRLHKHALYEKIAEAGVAPVSMMLMYIAKEELSFAEIEAGVKKMVRKWPGDGKPTSPAE